MTIRVSEFGFGEDDPMTAQSVATPGLAGIRPLAWILIVAAIAAAAIAAVGQGLLRSAFVVEPISISNMVGSAAGFALAAALLIGADRWPSGRAWLLGAAVALTLWGALEVVLQIRFITMQADPRVAGDLETAGLFGRTFVSLGSLAVGTGLAAAGLWRARPPAEARRADTPVAVAIGVIAAVAIGGSVALGLVEASTGPAALLTIAYNALFGLVSLATALLVAAASRYRPFGHHLPELAIFAGALALLLVAAVRPWTLVLVPLEIDFETSKILFGVPQIVGVIGTVLVVTGFASGRPALGAGSADGPLSRRD